MRRLARGAAFVLVALAVLAVVVRLRFGGGQRLEDRTTDPALPPSALQVVANLDGKKLQKGTQRAGSRQGNVEPH